MSQFLKNILKLSSGSVLSQIIGVLTMPVVTRLFEPQAFGVFGVFISIAGVTSIIANLRYQLAIMIPQDEIDASNLLILSVFFPVIFSFLLLISMYFLAPFAEKFGLLGYDYFVYMVPLITCFIGLYQAFNRWHSRHQRFSLIAKSMVLQKIISQGVMLVSGFLGFVSGIFLIWARIIGQFVSFCILFFYSYHKEKNKIIESYQFKKSIQVMIEYKNFPKYDLWSGLVNSASQNLPVILFYYFFSSEVVGYFVLVRQVLDIPMMFVGSAIGQVFFQKASVAVYEGKLSELVYNLYDKLVVLGMFPFLVLLVSGQELFAFVFGNEWMEAGNYIEYLAIWIFLNFVSAPLSTIFSVVDKLKFFMCWNFILFFSRVLIIVVFAQFDDPKLVVFFYGLIGVAAYLFLNMIIVYYSGGSVKKAIFILLGTLIKTIPFVFFIKLGLFWGLKNLYLVVFIIFVALLYYLIIIFSNSSLRKIFFSFKL